MPNPFYAMMVRPLMRRRNAKRLAITVAEGIREERFVDIGGVQQWVSIRGQDRGNPVLLFVHGGPGSPYTALSSILLDWEKDFTIVQWDQRGGGRTFAKNGIAGSGQISLELLANDGIELTEYLQKRIGQSKIVLLGSSVGSLIGLLMIRDRPDLFSAYVGANQNSPDTRHSSTYLLTKEAAQKAGDKKGLALLNTMGSDRHRWTIQQLTALNKLAIRLTTGVPNMISDIMLPALLWAPDYSMRDIAKVQTGMEFSMEQLFDELISTDIRRLGYRVEVPFFIFQGEGDILTPFASAKAYFDEVSAPHKAFVPIRAGHLAEFANPEQFLQGLREHVLPIARR